MARSEFEKEFDRTTLRYILLGLLAIVFLYLITAVIISIGGL